MAHEQTTPFDPAQSFMSPEDAVKLIMLQQNPHESLIAVINANIQIEEYGFASELITEYGLAVLHQQLMKSIKAESKIAPDHMSSTLIRNWKYYFEETASSTFENTHQIDIEDHSTSSGQVYVTIGATDGNLDDLLSVTMEVNCNPLTGIEDVPCAHIYFDADALAFKMFKIGDKILIEPESSVTFTPFSIIKNEVKESYMWVK